MSLGELLASSATEATKQPKPEGVWSGMKYRGAVVLLREEEGACRSGRQVAGMRVAGDLACACPGQLGQAAVPCLCFPVLAFFPTRFLLFPNCFSFSPSFYLAFPSNLRHVRTPEL